MPPPEEDIVIGGEEPEAETPPVRRGRPRKVGRKAVKKRAPAKRRAPAKKAAAAKKAPVKRAPVKKAVKKTARRRAVKKAKKLVPHAVNVATQTYDDGRVGVVVGKDGFDLGHFTLTPGVGSTSQNFIYYDKV